MTSVSKRRKEQNNLFGTSALKEKASHAKRTYHYNSAMRHKIKAVVKTDLKNQEPPYLS